MKTRWISALAALLAGTGMAVAQQAASVRSHLELEMEPPVASRVAMPDTEQPPADGPSRDREYILRPGDSDAAPRSLPPLAPTAPVTSNSKPSTLPSSSPPSLAPVTSGCAAGSPGSDCKSCDLGYPCAGEEGRLWANAEYLLWYIKGSRVPALIGTLPNSLVTTSNLPRGAIHTVFGNTRLDFHTFDGGRFTLGGWLDDAKDLGIEGSYLFLGRESLSFSGTSTSTTVVGPIFFDRSAGRVAIITPSTPATSVEHAHASADESLWGAELNARTRACYFGGCRIDLLAGFRYMDLDDHLRVTSSIDFDGTFTRTYSDSFTTHNRYYGGQVGAAFDCHEGPWSLNVIGKLALGGMDRSVSIKGFTQETAAGGTTQAFSGGLLTQQSNIGRSSGARFAVLPELKLNLGYQFTPRVRAYIGYSILGLENVIRPGDAIDTSVNPRNIRGLTVANPTLDPHPLRLFRDSDIWAQGINLGLEFTY